MEKRQSPTFQKPIYREHMATALKLAARGRGLTSPNPMVGAIIVRQGRVVGKGYHLYSTRDHAEVHALREAGSQATGADLYVTLEPCNHHGRTPPCCQAIISSGIRRVFIAVRDPNPDVRGSGVEVLREAGIETSVGLCEKEARDLNEAFFHVTENRTPFITLKLALTLDGRIATQKGESKWITGETSRKSVQRLRFENDAILVGVETVLQDDPSLDVRWRRAKPTTKVILDSRLRTPPDARLFLSRDRVLIFHSSQAPTEKISALSNKAELVAVEGSKQGLSWDEVLGELAREKLSSVLVEGGGRVAASLIREERVNRLILFYGPRMLGAEGVPAVAKLEVASLVDAPSWEVVRTRRLPPDFMVEARPGRQTKGSD